MEGPALVLAALVLLLVFVSITLFELWMLKKLGLDIFGHLQLTLKRGRTARFFFEAFGAVAFIMVQPVLLSWLFARISDDLASRFETFSGAASGILY